MASTYVVQNQAIKQLLFPVSGAGSNVPVGTLLMPGVTAGTNIGVLIPVTASSNADAVGVLNELHNYSGSGDATTATLVQWFPLPAVNSNAYQLGVKLSGGGPYPSHPVELLDNSIAIKVDYSLVSTVAVASATTTALTITSEVANEDSTFVYVNAGTGIGQLGFIKSSTTDTLTLISALTTTLDSTSKLTKILPLFMNTVVWLVNSTTVPTQLDSVAGLGSGRACVLANFINKNGLVRQLDPKIDHNAQSLNSLAQLGFSSFLQVQDTSLHPID